VGGRIGKDLFASEDLLLEPAEERTPAAVQSSRADSDNTESNLLKAAKYSPITGSERKRIVSSKRNHFCHSFYYINK
jgi:hypothetical protein